MDRRAFLANLTVFSGGIALAGSAFGNRDSAFSSGKRFSDLKAAGFGELAPVAAKNTGETYLALPKGFEYNVLGKVKGQMSDGRPTPPAHDGMWAFKVGNEPRLVRNHEVVNGSVPRAGSAIGTSNHYDDAAAGVGFVLGVVGAFLGGLIGTRLGWGKIDAGDLDLRSIAIATFGALVVLGVGRLLLGRERR